MKYILFILITIFILSCGEENQNTAINTKAVYPSDTSFLTEAGDMRISAGIENFWKFSNFIDQSTVSETYNFQDRSYTLPKLELEQYQIVMEALNLDGKTIARGISSVVDINNLKSEYPVFITPVNQALGLSSANTGLDDNLKNLEGHSVTALPDGRALIWGGKGASGSSVSNVYVYNPMTRQTASLKSNIQRSFHTATLYYLDYSDKNNPRYPRVLISGGKNAIGEYIDQAEVFNPETNKIEELIPQIISAKINQAAAAANNGFIYFFGGRYLEAGSEFYSTDIISFNPSKKTFGIVTNLPNQVENATATYIHNENKILVIGGNSANTVYSTVYMFDANSPNSSYLLPSNLLSPRTLHQAVLYNNKVYLIGGFSSHTGSSYSNPLKTIEATTTSSITDTVLCSLGTARGRLTVNLVNTNTIIAIGGDDGNKQPIQQAEVVQLKKDSCLPSGKTIPMLAPRYSSKSVLTANGLTFVVGGTASDLSTATPVEIINVFPQE